MGDILSAIHEPPWGFVEREGRGVGPSQGSMDVIPSFSLKIARERKYPHLLKRRERKNGYQLYYLNTLIKCLTLLRKWLSRNALRATYLTRRWWVILLAWKLTFRLESPSVQGYSRTRFRSGSGREKRNILSDVKKNFSPPSSYEDTSLPP